MSSTNSVSLYIYYVHGINDIHCVHCCVIVGDYIPFLELGRTADVSRVPLMSTLDSKSANISIPVPFAFGSTRLTSLAVSSNSVCDFDLIKS